jgi:protein-L-isoaspartate(D-aspartate) O-methyltransferase
MLTTRRLLPCLSAALLLAGGAAAQQPGDGPAWRTLRREMVDRVLIPAGIRDRTTLDAMRAVPRHLFVPADKREYAYEETPIPIGHDATISAPVIVAIMTEEIRPRPGMRVLEVGTGSGYQAAVLAQIGCRVWSIEIVRALADSARARLEALGYRGIEVRHGDGYAGWPEEAPFDAVLVTAAAPEIPPALVDQLAAGGRMVLPVGPPGGVQYLVVVEKDRVGRTSERRIEAVRFVPLRRDIR